MWEQHLGEWGVTLRKGGAFNKATQAANPKTVRETGNLGAVSELQYKSALAGLAAIGFDLAELADPTGGLSLMEACYDIYQAEFMSAGFALIGAVPAAGKLEKLAMIAHRFPSYLRILHSVTAYANAMKAAKLEGTSEYYVMVGAAGQLEALADTALHVLNKLPLGAQEIARMRQTLTELKNGCLRISHGSPTSRISKQTGAQQRFNSKVQLAKSRP